VEPLWVGDIKGVSPLSLCYLVILRVKVTRKSAMLKTPMTASTAPMPCAQPVGCGAHWPYPKAVNEATL